MKVRFATLNDKNVVLRLLNQLGEVEDRVRGYSPERTKAHEFGDALYRQTINDKNSKIFLAEEDGEIQGVATLFLVPNIRFGKYRGYIVDFVVNKNLRGKGIGKMLLESIKEFAKSNNIPRIKVDTGLPDAKLFYAKNGGKITTESFTFSTD